MMFRGAAILPVLLVLLGCASSQPAAVSEPPVTMPTAFSESGQAELPPRWWTVFGEPELNALMDEAFDQNFDLRAARSRLHAARAVADREAAAQFPVLDLFADGGYDASDAGSEKAATVGLAASYEVDLWGRIEAQTEAERYRAAASAADYQAAAVSLSAEIVRAWMRVREERSLLHRFDLQVDANEKRLELLRERYSVGQSAGVDVLRQEQLLAETRQSQEASRGRLRVLQHQLAVLAGKAPRSEAAVADGRGLPELPPLPATGLPAELVERRPDVRRAFLDLQAANRDTAAAISDQYPRLNLAAALSSTQGDASQFFETWALSFASSLTAPLLDGGARRAEVDRTEARELEALYRYGQAVLVAFQEVEDALVLERQQRRQIAQLEEQLRLAEASVEQLTLSYETGGGKFLDVLEALSDQQRLHRELIMARRQLIDYRVGLYRALAGGYGLETEQTDA